MGCNFRDQQLSTNAIGKSRASDNGLAADSQNFPFQVMREAEPSWRTVGPVLLINACRKKRWLFFPGEIIKSPARGSFFMARNTLLTVLSGES